MIAPQPEGFEHRKFAVLFVCEDCQHQHEIEATTIYVKRWFGLNDITQHLTRYAPFCCEKCGSDDFGIQTWTEIK